ncbi:unnamed protein product [Rhizoctonia solani]|uniref:Uncharacterized protein n=1 Tax=Rhizoctonia solani TaxID=456999 RepID=A0A8H2WN30_9AGAM|nr:unnamed protein product [Rhizoctonia solani]
MLHSSSPTPPYLKRCDETSKIEGKIATNDYTAPKECQIHQASVTRYAQGHRVPLNSQPYSPNRVPKTTVNKQDFDCHRREVRAIVSTLGSRIGVLENTLAVALPVIAEARILWMENAVIITPTKLKTTRRAFCEYYKNSRYETYTRFIRARAYYLGLTLVDLEYLQERLKSLGFQSAKQETLLIGPFGGANELGDKTMVEAYRWGSKHGAYVRRIWRACYDSAYSLDEGWMSPIPAPDSSTLVSKIKKWLHAS